MTKLLIITQKVDSSDPILGFFVRWIEEFSKYTEKLTVICLEKGEYDLPENVKVLSLGKEAGKSRVKYLFNFYRHIWRERKNYDAVFVHMNPEYVIWGWADWKILGKKIALWYTHKSVDLKLRLAEKLVNKIFTASRESFRLLSKKVEVLGHGIDTNKFSTQKSPVYAEAFTDKKLSDKLRVITAGRIAPIKNLKILINTAEILKNQRSDFEVKIVGKAITESDKIYFEELELMIQKKGLEKIVSFAGPYLHLIMPDFYNEGDVLVNLSETGSVDKAVLEAMACGITVITSNEAFKNILPSRYFLDQKTPEALAEKLQKLLGENRPNLELRDIVVQNHSLDKLIKKIVSAL